MHLFVTDLTLLKATKESQGIMIDKQMTEKWSFLKPKPSLTNIVLTIFLMVRFRKFLKLYVRKL